VEARIGVQEVKKYFSNVDLNVGIVLGDASGVVDVDIDDDEALRLADHFLPKTAMVFGRKSRPRSHSIYKVIDAGALEKFRCPDTLAVIVEVRGNGHQTVFPGSVHPSGECIEFDSGRMEAPSTSSWSELVEACRKLSIATLLLKHWKPGSRHDLALAAAGLFALNGWTEKDAKFLIRTVAREAGEQEVADRVSCVASSFERRRAGEPVASTNTLNDLLGQKECSALQNWANTSKGNLIVFPPRQTPPTAHSNIPALATDVDRAKAFAEHHQDNLIYADKSKQWHLRKSGVFAPVTDVVV